MDLLLVRYYDACPLEDYNCDVDLSLQHWFGKKAVQKLAEKQSSSHATLLWIAVLLYSKPAYVCPHFQNWDEGQRQHFLVNDLLTLGQMLTCYRSSLFSIMVTQWHCSHTCMLIMCSPKDVQIEWISMLLTVPDGNILI